MVIRVALRAARNDLAGRLRPRPIRKSGRLASPPDTRPADREGAAAFRLRRSAARRLDRVGPPRPVHGLGASGRLGGFIHEMSFVPATKLPWCASPGSRKALQERCGNASRTWSSCRSQDVARSVTDVEITTENVFKSAMRPRQISERPAVPPVAIHWPKMLLNQLEDRVEIAFSDQPALLTEGDIELLDHNRTGPLHFSVRDDVHTAELEVVFGDRGARYPQTKARGRP